MTRTTKTAPSVRWSCLPRRICSWDYIVPDAAGGPALLTFRSIREQGFIESGGVRYLVHREGLWRKKWTLEGGGFIASAEMTSAWGRSFRIRARGMTLEVRPKSAFSRRHELMVEGRVLGTIQPVHAFTRRATIDFAAGLPPLLILFAFWLVACTWLRSAGTAAAPGGA